MDSHGVACLEVGVDSWIRSNLRMSIRPGPIYQVGTYVGRYIHTHAHAHFSDTDNCTQLKYRNDLIPEDVAVIYLTHIGRPI